MTGSIVRRTVLAVFLAAFSAASFAQVAVGISVRIGPPALPVYAQPICPGPGYMWTPGYWAWNDVDGYYWVPGTWVLAPVGMLWTPGYWGWGGGVYLWHPGYWGPHVGFYGGINYGYGYTGVGFAGGEWRGRSFYYNRSVTNVNVVNVTNVYNRTVVVNKTVVNNVSYNGGSRGVVARPTPQEETYSRERHTAPLAVQSQHQQMASRDRQNFASVNQGRPAIAATARPADFSGRSVVAARAAGGQYHAPAMSPREARVNAAQPTASRSTPTAENRQTSAATNRSNEGFRPFTPPSKSNAPAASNVARNNPSGGNANRPNSNQPGSNQGFRSFTPPSKNNAPVGNNMTRNNPSGGNANRPNSNEGFRSFTPPTNNRANDNRPSEGRNSDSRPQAHYNAPNNARPTLSREAPNQSAPHSNSGQERRQGPPAKEERR